MKITKLIFIWVLLVLFASFNNLNGLNAQIHQHHPGEQCGTVVSEESIQYIKNSKAAIDKFIKEYNPALKNANDRIPLKVHMLINSMGPAEPIPSLEDLQTAINTVNEIYDPMNMEFFICGEIDFIDDDVMYSNGIRRFDEPDSEGYLLDDYNLQPGYLNIYLGPILDDRPLLNGYAYTPDNFTTPTNANGTPIGGINPPINNDRDVIALKYDALLNGTTFAHELGHYFGLLHTWSTATGEELVERGAGNNCTTSGDLICDTEADPGRIYAYNATGTDSISLDLTNNNCVYIGDNDNLYPISFLNDEFVIDAPPRDEANEKYVNIPASNIMSRYSCRNSFTPTQELRIRYFFENARGYLFNETNCSSSSCFDANGNNIVKAGFDFDVTGFPDVEFDVKPSVLTHNSQNAPGTTYEWYFADGNTGTGIDPTHTYTYNGVYNVCVIATDPNNGCQAESCQRIESNQYSVCELDLNLTGPLGFNCSMNASNNITSSNEVYSFCDSVEYSAGGTIIFGDGTLLSQGSFVVAYIYDCSQPVNKPVATNEDETQAKTDQPTNPLLNRMEADAEVGNYPNPFANTTDISFTVKEATNVTVTVFDIKGQEIARLLDNEVRDAGRYIVNFDGSQLTGGIYFYTVQTDQYKVTQKMMLHK